MKFQILIAFALFCVVPLCWADMQVGAGKRMARYGITRSFMDAGNPFYRKIGFKEMPYSYYPWIKSFKA